MINILNPIIANIFPGFMWSMLGYIDPGTGSIIIQALIAGVLGVSVAAKIYWHRILKFLKIGKTAKTNDPPESDSTES